MRRLVIASLALPWVLVGGCSGGGGGGSTKVRPASVTPAAVVTPVTLSAAAYMASASSIDLYQMKAAQLVLERSHDPGNRAFAEHALSASQGTSAQLSFAGRRLNLLPSATLAAQHQAMLDTLASASDFDKTYRAQQGIVLQEGLKLHSNYAKAGTSPTLRPVAANAEAVMRANLKELRGSR